MKLTRCMNPLGSWMFKIVSSLETCFYYILSPDVSGHTLTMFQLRGKLRARNAHLYIPTLRSDTRMQVLARS